MNLVILQPGYLPWLGFFEQMHRADLFVMFDDVQFDKHGWRNRNRIRTKEGFAWLTVPVNSSGKPRVNEVLIENKHNWRKKHLGALTANYSGAPFFKDYFDELGEIIMQPHEKLIDLDVAIIFFLKKSLGIKTDITFSSKLSSKGSGAERVVNICRELGAKQYISGDAGRDYLNEEDFLKNGIKLTYQNYKHPEYKQVYKGFVPYMSTVDILFNKGKESLSLLAGE